MGVAGDDSVAADLRTMRLARAGQLVATIGHDLRNPLGVISSSLFVLRSRVGDDARALRHVDKIARQVRACEAIITDLLALVRDEPPRLVDVGLREVVDDMLETIAIPDAISIALEIADDVRLRADVSLLRQALVNLVSNAMNAVGEDGGELRIVATVDDDDSISIAVEDDGPGFDPAFLPRAFEPLASNREGGTGLGLALVRTVAETHGGAVTAENRSTGGGRVQLVLPRGTPSD
jgi:signal transduction histidine kinase